MVTAELLAVAAPLALLRVTFTGGLVRARGMIAAGELLPGLALVGVAPTDGPAGFPWPQLLRITAPRTRRLTAGRRLNKVLPLRGLPMDLFLLDGLRTSP